MGVNPLVGGWTDPGHARGTWCYRLQTVNRHGASRPATTRAMARWAPGPDPPVADAPTWRPALGGWQFTWHAPAGTSLVALRDASDPGRAVCRRTTTPRWSAWTSGGQDRWLLHPSAAGTKCVTLAALTEWGTTSIGDPMRLTVTDRPAAPVLGTPTWVAGQQAYRITWTPPDDFTSLWVMRDYDDPSRCPTAFDADRAETPWQEQTGRRLVPAAAARECLSFFAVTAWGTSSTPTEVPAQVPAPTATPTVGRVSVDPDDPSAARASVSITASASYQLGIEVVDGACPVQPAADAGWFDGWEVDPGSWRFYPESSDGTGPQCAMFAAVDWFGQPGPVVERPFSVAGS